MKGARQVIEHLNKVLGNELIAINQYFLHSRILKDWGVSGLASYQYRESLEEMKHADQLTQRILFLDGLPNLQKLGKLTIGQSVEEMLKADLDLEHRAREDLIEGIRCCEEVGDFTSRQLLGEILDAEETHVDWLETQFAMIKDMGLQNYIQLRSSV